MGNPFFKPVPRWDMQTARAFLDKHKLDQYTLLDVRQPGEFAQGHLPGAKLVSLDELDRRLDELDRGKPMLVYCHSGGRAGNAVALLSRLGFDQAYNIGGIMQWNGLVATGAPEAGTAWFDPAREPAEYVALAWVLEHNAMLLYQDLATRLPALGPMFEDMASGEGLHEQLLARLHGELTGQEQLQAPADLDPPDMMEGGIPRAEALKWLEGKSAMEALDLTVALEANAYDRYVRVGRELAGEAQRVFVELAEAEKVHLDRLVQALREQAAS